MDNEVPPIHTPPPPPIVSAPPPIIVNTPPPQRSGGRGWMFLSFALLIVVGLMFFGPMARMVAGASKHTTGVQSGRYFEEITVENPSASDKIVIIDLDGIITSEPWDRSGHSMVDTIADQLKLASKDDSVKAVILKVNSPGGEVMASDDIARSIRDFQAKYNKPVIASMGSVAASGGYYVSAPCQYIVANDLTMTGSIGVIMSSFNYRALMDKIGLQPKVFKSGKFKDMLRGSKRPEEIDPEEEKMIQDMIMQTYGKFKEVVQNGRAEAAKKNASNPEELQGKTLASNWADYADGRVLTGKNAFELGFVDQLGTFQNAVETTTKLVGVRRAHLIRYEEPFNLGRLLGFGVQSRADSKVLKVDLGLDMP
jgi:protease-4